MMSPLPIILESDGTLVFVVLPYARYLELTTSPPPASLPPVAPAADAAIPDEVIELMTRHGWTILRAWREYLGMTQSVMAIRLGVRQPTYAAMEAPRARPRQATRARIAAALGILPSQLDV
ncbi:helix-turn-helix domain-containing protein [Ralstonia pseudosolanacearum]|uniref:helix-turn-helix domain-containing protein n=1 Tax=Ralstonia pseudosolanacearum TaxID=1310165 RepID=UPI003D26860E